MAKKPYYKIPDQKKVINLYSYNLLFLRILCKQIPDTKKIWILVQGVAKS